MGHAQAAMPNISARGRESWRGASPSAKMIHFPAGPLGGCKQPIILIMTLILAMGPKRLAPLLEASI